MRQCESLRKREGDQDVRDGSGYARVGKRHERARVDVQRLSALDEPLLHDVGIDVRGGVNHIVSGNRRTRERPRV